MNFKYKIELDKLNSIYGRKKYIPKDQKDPIDPKEVFTYLCDFRVLVRRCYIGIFNDMIENMHKAGNNPNIYKPQCCFLIYGSKGIGKTCLCYYLSFKFRTLPEFSHYDIIIFNEGSTDEHQPCYVRGGGDKGKSNTRKFIYSKEYLPIKGNNTIVISDGIPIHEDEFSEDDIVIFISSPKSSEYKIFRNKREPIQYYITQIEDDELNAILHLHRFPEDQKKKLLNDAKIFGGSIEKACSWNKIKLEKEEKVDLCVYIPKKFNEDFLIYDTNCYNEIPTKLRFISPEIQKYMLCKHYNSVDCFVDLFDIFNDTGNERIFERLVHILVENGYIKFGGQESQCIIDGSDYDLKVVVEDSSKVSLPCYIDFSIYYTFTAIDGCNISESEICGLQMTLKKEHEIKKSLIYEENKDKIIQKLKSYYDLKIDANFVTNCLYNFGYTPNRIKKLIIYPRIVKLTGKNESFVRLTNSIKKEDNVWNIINKNDQLLNIYNINLQLKGIEQKTLKSETFVYYYIMNKIVFGDKTVKADEQKILDNYKNLYSSYVGNKDIQYYTTMLGNNSTIRDALKNSKNYKVKKLLYDLDDYLIEKAIENDPQIEDRILNSIISELEFIDKERYDKIIDELKYCNPRFLIQFFTYGKDEVTGKLDEEYDINFVNYGEFADPMKKYLSKIYNWNKIEDVVKKSIIDRRSKRIRFNTFELTYSSLCNMASSKQKDDSRYVYIQRDEKIEIGKKVDDIDDIYDSFVNGYKIPIIKGEENTIQVPSYEYGLDKEKEEEIYTDGIKDIKEEVNSLYKIFNNLVEPKISSDRKVLKINHQMFQYPDEKVYIRKIYNQFSDILINTIELNRNQKKLNDNANQESFNTTTANRTQSLINYYKGELLKILPSKNNYKNPNCFLLRGNPGLGKSSFIIYFLYMLRQHEINKYNRFVTHIYKSTKNKEKSDSGGRVIYEYKDGNMNKISSESVCDIVISDSYDYGEDIDSKYLVLYVSSPDMKNYGNFNKYDDDRKHSLYLDVFSETEINEWKDNCLPKNIADHVDKKLYDKYGRVPRHIYFDAVYKEYFKKEYWDDIYTKGINTVIGDIGFIDFIKKYILPCKKDEKDKLQTIPDLTLFDITLCHYIVKYKFDTLYSIDEYSMEFISKDVFTYMINSIRHVSRKSEVTAIKKIFFEHIRVKYYHPLYQFLFQELVWCKFVYYTSSVINVTPVDRIDKTVFKNVFSKLFDSPIYETSEKNVYILLLMSLQNGEVIYLMNNCFIHVHNDCGLCYDNSNMKKNSNEVNTESKFIFNISLKMKIRKCISLLQNNLGWNKFFFVCVHPDNPNEKIDNRTGVGSSFFHDDLLVGFIDHLPLYEFYLNYENYNKEVVVKNSVSMDFKSLYSN